MLLYIFKSNWHLSVDNIKAPKDNDGIRFAGNFRQQQNSFDNTSGESSAHSQSSTMLHTDHSEITLS